MLVCMCVHAHVCGCARACVRVYVYACVRACVRACVTMYACMRACGICAIQYCYTYVDAHEFTNSE